MKRKLCITLVTIMLCYVAARVDSRNQPPPDGAAKQGDSLRGAAVEITPKETSGAKRVGAGPAYVARLAAGGELLLGNQPAGPVSIASPYADDPSFEPPLKIVRASQPKNTNADASNDPVRALTSTARKDHFINEFNAEYRDITGKSVVAAVFDEMAVYHIHQEFRVDRNKRETRVEVISRKGPSFHPTHVAATMAAAGIDPDAKGMAPGLKILSYDYDKDLDDLEAIANRIQVSNHSYGPVAGWDPDERAGKWKWWGNAKHSTEEDSRFGKYLWKSERVDRIIFNSPRLSAFFAAGNERDDLPQVEPGTGVLHEFVLTDDAGNRRWHEGDNYRHPDNFDRNGLDTILDYCIAKNVICIGSVNSARSQGPSAPGVVSPISSEPYSSWGPTDDGRVKPDLVANGHAIRSASNADVDAYAEESGTSMASPVAAGIGALLVQLLQKERPQFIDYSAAVVKAVLIHTATDDGELPGPDPKFGWGSINAYKAGRVIARKDGAVFRHFITVGSLGQGEVEEIGFDHTDDSVKATLVWIDPPGQENKAGLDDPTPALVNDLDITLIAPDGQIYYPYSIDLERLKTDQDRISPARRDRPNRVDNVEMVEAGRLEGKWKVIVKATSLKQEPKQRFALVVSGLTNPTKSQ